MEFLVWILFAVLTVAAYYLGKRNFLFPGFLLCAIYLVTYTILLCNLRNWQVQINGYFVLYTFTALLAFITGEMIVVDRSKRIAINSTKVLLPLGNQTKRAYPAVSFLLISAVLTIAYTTKLIADALPANSFAEMLRNIYNKSVDGYSPGILFNQFREIITAIAYVNTFRLMRRMFNGKDNMRPSVLIAPILFFLIMVAITTDRNIFLRYVFYFVCLYILFFYSQHKKKANWKLFKRILGIAVFAVICFFLFGKIKQYTSDFSQAISIYGGSGLQNFNIWIKDYNGPLLFGKATFSVFLRSLQTVFSAAGIALPIETLERFDSFITYTSANGYLYSSNIYSALKPFVMDFGYIGVILYPFFMGLLYQWLFLKTKRQNGFYWVLYSMLIYPILFFPILDQLFGRLTLGFLYELFWLWAVYRYAFGKDTVKKRRENRNEAK